MMNINYLDYGTDKKGTIVLLHGWGQNISMMDMLGHPFEKDYRIIVLDLPGFGKSDEPDKAWSVLDYTKWLNKFLTSLNIKNPILVGHSFGGRISICYAGMYKTNKVVLLSSPFRPQKNGNVTLKVKIYKFTKKVKFLHKLSLKLKERWESTDYKNASDINRGTLVKVVNEDLTEYAKKIKAPTLLIYGDKDTDVLLSEGKYLNSIIKDSGLIEYKGYAHYAYLDNLPQTIAVLNEFFKEQK